MSGGRGLWLFGVRGGRLGRDGLGPGRRLNGRLGLFLFRRLGRPLFTATRGKRACKEREREQGYEAEVFFHSQQQPLLRSAFTAFSLFLTVSRAVPP